MAMCRRVCSLHVDGIGFQDSRILPARELNANPNPNSNANPDCYPNPNPICNPKP